MTRRELIALLGSAPAAWLLLARAQNGKTYRVGFLSMANFVPGTLSSEIAEDVTRKLGQDGYTAGSNLELVRFSADLHSERCLSSWRKWWRRKSM